MCMFKDLLIGLSIGIIAGAFLVKNNKKCSDAVEAVSDAAEKKMKEMCQKKPKEQ